jgi:ribosomal protein S18 acetylase RimI-like enzyme
VTGSGIEVSPATPEEAQRLLDESGRAFADALVRHRGLSVDQAADELARGTAALLPEGPATPGHLFLAARLEGRMVGGVWAAASGPDRPDAAWIYYLGVEPPARRRGLGRRLMEEATIAVRARGARFLHLNVFGDNGGAIALYESLGFTVMSQQMAKPLS